MTCCTSPHRSCRVVASQVVVVVVVVENVVVVEIDVVDVVTVVVVVVEQNPPKFEGGCYEKDVVVVVGCGVVVAEYVAGYVGVVAEDVDGRDVDGGRGLERGVVGREAHPEPSTNI